MAADPHHIDPTAYLEELLTQASPDLMRQMQGMQQGGASRQDSNIIDGEAREVTPDAKKIEMKDVNK